MSRRRERSPESTGRSTRPRIESNRNNNPAFITDLRREIDSYNVGLSTIEAAMADARGEIRRGSFEPSRGRRALDSTDESILTDPRFFQDEDEFHVNVGAYPYYRSRAPHNPWNGYYNVQRKHGDLGFEPEFNYVQVHAEGDREQDAYYKRHRDYYRPGARDDADLGPSTAIPRLSQRRLDYPVNSTAVLRNENAIVGLRNEALLRNLNRGRLYGLDGNTMFSPPTPEFEPTSPFPMDIVEEEALFGEGIKKTRCWKGYKPVKGKKAYSKGSCKKAK